MTQPATIRRALISVFDKTGVGDFARELHEQFGAEILSTGGTAAAIEAAGVPVTRLETITGFTQLLDGRVKTLHPKVFAAILADRDNPQHMQQLAEAGIEPIDLVVVGLYPFEQTICQPDCTFERAIEMIDIGGVALLRAAAKNCKHVWAACVDPPEGYQTVLAALGGGVDDQPAAIRQRWAARTLGVVSHYDAAIRDYLLAPSLEIDPAENARRFPPALALLLEKRGPARYGENPHQRAALYRDRTQGVRLALRFKSSDHGFSYNNVLDADAALRLCGELSQALPNHAICCFIKHTNPCGVGLVAGDARNGGIDPRLEAYRRAYLGDPNAAMGGILAVNFPVTAQFATAVMETYDRWGRPLREAGAKHAPGGFFVEVFVAPDFDPDAVEIIRGRSPDGPSKRWGGRVRLVRAGQPLPVPDEGTLEYRSVLGGMLVQSADAVGLNDAEWRVVSKRSPSDAEWRDLKLAWLICKHTRSNAITICRDGMLIGNGAGQTSRVLSCRIATWQARENGHAERLAGAVAASDAFFPFRDGPEVLIDAGVRAIIQPGGSKRDDETVAACDAHDVALVFTGTRHFRH